MFGNVKYRFKACELTGKDLIELRAHFLSLRGVSKRFANIAVSSRAARTLKARDPAHLTRPPRTAWGQHCSNCRTHCGLADKLYK